MAPKLFDGSVSIFGASIPKYNFFLLLIGPIVAVGLWLFTSKTKLGKIARAAAVDREMVGAVGINVSWVFAFAFVFGCFMAGLGGALMAPTISITLGMDHNLIIEGFLIVTIGGLGNMWAPWWVRSFSVSLRLSGCSSGLSSPLFFLTPPW